MPDSKRRRLTVYSPASSQASSSSRDEERISSFDESSFPLNVLSGNDISAIEEAVVRLRKSLTSKDATSRFLASHERFKSLMTLLSRANSEATMITSPWSAILGGAVSCVGNVCNFSLTACLELKKSHYRFAHLGTSLLESGGRTSAHTKASVLRVIGNLCQHKETALFISEQSALVDRVCLMLEDEDSSIAVAALRIIRRLLERHIFKTLLSSNAGFYLGKVLSTIQDEKKTDEVMTMIGSMVKWRVRDTGRQLAMSGCCPRLLALFLSPSSTPATRTLVLKLATLCTDIRDGLGTPAIDQIVALGEEGGSPRDEEYGTLLSAFTQDAWGRAHLRESGGLELLVRRLAASTNTAEKGSIILSFRHLVHDTTSMAFLCRSRPFMDTLIRDIRDYVCEYGEECTSWSESDALTRPLSPILLDWEARSDGRRSRVSTSDGHGRSPGAAWSPWSSSPSPSWSNSPPSSGLQSPSRLSQVLSSPSGRESLDESASISSGDEEREERKEREEKETSKMTKQLVDNEIWLLGWQANEDANLPFLIREDLVSALLSILRRVHPHANRAGRPLKKMAESRHSIQPLLEMHFDTRVFHALCRSPCRLRRFAARCSRCEQDAEFGSEILRTLASNVDSDFGNGVLLQRLTSPSRETKTAAAIAKVSLVRNRFRLCRPLSAEEPPAMQFLLGELLSLLEEKEETVQGKSLYEEGPPLASLILGALSTLIDPMKIKDVFEVEETWKPPTFTPCKLADTRGPTDDQSVPSTSTADDEQDKQDVVTLVSNEEILAEIPLDDLMHYSEYFQGMFSSDLMETRQRRRRLEFRPEVEDVPIDVLRIFVHSLAGCSPSVCVSSHLDNPQKCSDLLRLADKYLVSSLSSWLGGAHGPAKRLMEGESVGVFLPLALRLPSLHRLLEGCILTLLRFSSSSQCVAALSAVAGNAGAAGAFVETLEAFVLSHSHLPFLQYDRPSKTEG